MKNDNYFIFRLIDRRPGGQLDGKIVLVIAYNLPWEPSDRLHKHAEDEANEWMERQGLGELVTRTPTEPIICANSEEA